MTAAQIRKAALIVKHCDDKMIVQFTEIGSEGCVLRIGGFGLKVKDDAWLIARNGDALQRNTGAVA